MFSTFRFHLFKMQHTLASGICSLGADRSVVGGWLPRLGAFAVAALGRYPEVLCVFFPKIPGEYDKRAFCHGSNHISPFFVG